MGLEQIKEILNLNEAQKVLFNDYYLINPIFKPF